MAHDNYIDNRGFGNWTVYLYNPGEQAFGPFEGDLVVSKDFHTIYTPPDVNGARDCIGNFPNPNVAAVINNNYQK